MYDPLAVLSHLLPRFAYTTSLAIVGIRGAKAGVIPPRQRTRCMYSTITGDHNNQDLRST